MKTKLKTMQDLAATFPDIYRKYKLLCHAQKIEKSKCGKTGKIAKPSTAIIFFSCFFSYFSNYFQLFFRCKLLPISNLKNGNEKK